MYINRSIRRIVALILLNWTLISSSFARQVEILLPPVENPPTAYGLDVEIAGSTMFVGSAESVYVYEHSETRWMLDSVLPNPGSETSVLFGSLVEASNDFLFISDPLDNKQFFNTGAIFVYENSDVGWQFKQRLSTSGLEGEIIGQNFGRSVSSDGGFLVVGAPLKSLVAIGGVYIFALQGGVWVESQLLTPSDLEAGSSFGLSVSISGNFLAVGAPGHHRHGAVFLFQQTNNQWVRIGILEPETLEENDSFGQSVALVGDRLFVSADMDNTASLGGGAVYVYRKIDAAIWQEDQKITPSSSVEGARFGFDLDISGNTLIVGTTGERDRRAFFFRYDGNSWNDIGTVSPFSIGAGNDFGRAVAIDGPVAAVGSTRDIASGSAIGAAYVYDVNSISTSLEKPNGFRNGLLMEQNFPNPARNRTTIRYSLGTSSVVSLRLYDVTGRVISRSFNRFQSVGEHEISISIESLPAGIYFYQLSTEQQALTRELLVVR